MVDTLAFQSVLILGENWFGCIFCWSCITYRLRRDGMLVYEGSVDTAVEELHPSLEVAEQVRALEADNAAEHFIFHYPPKNCVRASDMM